MGIRSKAAVAYGLHRDMRVEMIEVEPPQAGEVLVEIKATGLCHSDLNALEGTWTTNVGFPGILGHEAAGIVAEVGPGVTSFKPGDHVVAFTPYCGVCPCCTSGKTNICAAFFVDAGPNSRFRVGGQRAHPFMGLGTFTQYSVIREISLIKVREDAPLEQICYFGCGASTGIGAALYIARVTAGSSVVVFGLGGIGLNVVQGARLAGAATIIAVDTNSAKEAIARKMGATAFVNPKTIEGDLVAHLNELTGGGADFTFEAVGNVQLMRQAFEAAHFAWGTCTIIGIAPESDRLQIEPIHLVTGRRLCGAPMGGVRGREHIPQLIDWMMAGRIDLASLICAHLPIERINEGYAMMKRGEGIRSVVVFP
jgi:S-(hydroxymethyl)glutathione dehydrogenase / alcohol dehydrogenase